MNLKFSVAWMVIGIVISALPNALSEENPKTIIEKLPEIDFSKQCDKKDECDRTIEEKVFDTLTTLSGRYLKRGMPKNEVEKLFSRPSEADVDSWNDVRFGNSVTAWRYAVSLSGTTGFYIIFVNDRLDYFGQRMISESLYSYGKPGWSYGDDKLWKYRFRGREPG